MGSQIARIRIDPKLNLDSPVLVDHYPAMERLRCGAIISEAFIDYIEELYLREKAAHAGEVVAIEFTRCIDGVRKGQTWWRSTWTSRRLVPEHMLYSIGGIDVFLPPKTSKALKDHYIDVKNGQVVVT